METTVEKRAFVKAHKSLVKGLNLKQLALASDDELDSYIQTIKNHPDFEEPVSTETPAVETNSVNTNIAVESYELVTEKGEKVLVFKAPYLGRTQGGAFKFSFKESFIRTQSTALSSLNIRRPLTVGEEFIFKAESLKYNPEINCFEASLAYFANEAILKVTQYSKDTKAFNQDRVAMLISEGLSKKDAQEIVREETVASIKKSLQRPKLEL